MLRVPFEAANLAADVTNPAYGPLAIIKGAGALGQVGRAAQTASDPLGAAAIPLGLAAGRGVLGALPGHVKDMLAGLVVNPLLRAGEIVDLSPRLAVYDKLAPQGKTLAEAALASRSTTTDFSRGGDWTKDLNTAIPFLRSTMEGNRVVFHAITHGKAAARVAALPLIGTGLWWLNNRDEPTRQLDATVPDHVKDNDFYHVVGSHTDEYGEEQPIYAHYPGRALKALTLPVERLLSAIRSNGDEDLPDRVGTIFGACAEGVRTAAWNLTPIRELGSLLPAAVRPVAEVAANRDFFRDREIITPEMTGQPVEERATPWTSDLAPRVAPAIDAALRPTGLRLAPAQFDHLISG